MISALRILPNLSGCTALWLYGLFTFTFTFTVHPPLCTGCHCPRVAAADVRQRFVQ